MERFLERNRKRIQISSKTYNSHLYFKQLTHFTAQQVTKLNFKEHIHLSVIIFINTEINYIDDIITLEAKQKNQKKQSLFSGTADFYI